MQKFFYERFIPCTLSYLLTLRSFTAEIAESAEKTIENLCALCVLCGKN